MAARRLGSWIPVGVTSLVGLGAVLIAIPAANWAVWVTAGLEVAIIGAEVVRYRQGDRALWQVRR